MRDSFTIREAAQVSAVNPRTVYLWSRTGVLVPTASVKQGRGHQRLYTRQDLLALRVLAAAPALKDTRLKLVEAVRAKKSFQSGDWLPVPISPFLSIALNLHALAREVDRRIGELPARAAPRKGTMTIREKGAARG